MIRDCTVEIESNIFNEAYWSNALLVKKIYHYVPILSVKKQNKT